MKRPRPLVPVSPLACLPPANVPARRKVLPPLTLPRALPVALLLSLLPAGLPTEPPRYPRPAHYRFLTVHDTINGDRIADPLVIARIERIAAGVPTHLLSGQPRGANIRYLAQAFGSSDDAAISYGIFQEPAAALAFGCALDDHLVDRCEIAMLTMDHAAYEDPPGVRCVPIRLALGAPAYEPDRCQADAS